MGCIKDNDCWDSADYLEEFAEYRPSEDVTLGEFEEILEEREINLWNYPLTEIEHIIENEINVVLVRFPDEYDGYDYRFCEVPEEE